MIKTISLNKVEKNTFYFDDGKKKNLDLGGCRILCKYNDLCIKVGEQGKQEIEIFNSLEEWELPFYAPIVEHGKTPWNMGDWDFPTKTTWVAQPWISRIIKTTKEEVFAAEYKQIWEATRQRNLADIDYFQHKGVWILHNWTVINGAPVCYDYGF